MSPPAVVLEARSRAPGRLPRRETHDWAAVVARYAIDDWPPPEWLAVVAECGNDPREVPGFSVPAEERVAA